MPTTENKYFKQQKNAKTKINSHFLNLGFYANFTFFSSNFEKFQRDYRNYRMHQQTKQNAETNSQQQTTTAAQKQPTTVLAARWW